MTKLPRGLSGRQVRRAIDTGTLAAILDAAGIGAERFRELL
jgi:hypothetical protein